MILGWINRYLDSFKSQANTGRRSEAGNVFFTLFGAVALVGVVGVATSTLMRGPVGTVVKLNQRAKADAQMQIAQKLAMLEAAQQANSGDCDSDGYVEPIGPKTAGCSAGFPGITGGGCIPDEIGASKFDPWGTDYGYCSWDHGSSIGSGCGTNGADNLDGENLDNKVVIAIVSAGPDRTFNTTCNNATTYLSTTPGSDDIVLDITYSGAIQASGGLWRLQSGDPDTAEIDKNVYVSGRGDFEAGGRFGAGLDIDSGFLDMTAGSLIMLPDQGNSGACTGGTNDGALRRNTTSGNQVLEICDPNPPNSGWVDVASAGAASGAQGPDFAIQMSDGGSPAGFKYASALTYSAGGVLGTEQLNASSDATIGGNLTVNGATTDLNSKLEVSGALEVEGNVSSATGNLTIVDDTDLTGTLAITGSQTISSTLGVTGTSTLGTVNAGTTTVTNLNVGGTSILNGPVYNSSGNLNLNDAVDIGGDTDITGNLQASGNAEISGNVLGAAFINMYDGQNEGLYFDSANGLYLGVGGNPALSVDSGGDVGINLSGAATAQLDIDGEIRLRSSALYSSGAACSGPGMIAYNGADELLICSSITGLWETVGTSGGGGGSAGGVWDDEGSYIRYENGTYITNAGTSLNFSSSLEGAGTRLLWYTSQSAFRAGTVTGTQWDDSNVGQYSAAFGLDTTSDGSASFVAGTSSIATSDSAIALGSQVEARGTSSVALGNEAIVAAGATNSMAIGLGVPSTASNPQVLSSNSLAIFMGDQQNVNFNTANAMLLAGGKLIIDPDPTSATNIAPDNLLTVDVQGQVGATHYCDETGINCFLASDVAGGATPAPGVDTEVLFNSGGVLGADPAFVFYRSTGNMGLGVINPAAQIELSEQLLLGNVNDCTAATQGALRLNASGDVLEMCDFAGAADYIAIGGGAVTAPGTDTQVVYNSGGVLYATAAFTYNSAGQLSLGGGSAGAPKLYTWDVGNVKAGMGVDMSGGSWETNIFAPSNGSLGNIGFGFVSSADGTTYTQRMSLREDGILSLGDSTTGQKLNIFRNFAGNQRAGMGVDMSGGSWETNMFGISNGTLGHLSFGFVSSSDGTTYTEQMRLTELGELGVGVSVPQTAFDVEGTIKMAYGNEACDLAREGAIHFNSGDNNFYVCQSNGSGWQRVITAGGGGGGLPAAGADTQIQFNSGNTLAADANFVYTSAGDFGVGTSNPLARMQVEGGDIVFLSNGGGNVGIGISSIASDALLHIHDPATGNGAESLIRMTTGDSGPLSTDGLSVGYAQWAGDQYGFLWLRENEELRFGTNDAERMRIDADGIVRFTSTGATVLNVGDTSQRPTAPENGMIRYNTDNGRFEAFQAGTWQDILTGSGLASAPLRGVQFNSGGSFAADANFVYTSAGYLGLGTATPSGPLHVFDAMLLSNTFVGLGNTTPFALRRIVDDSFLTIAGGSTGNSGANIELYGPTHATNPNEILFRRDTSNLMRMDASGNFAIKGTLPQTRLDVGGSLKIAYGNEACDASREGAIHFDSGADRFYVCQNAAEGWVNIATDNADPAAPLRGVQFNSGGSFAADANFVYTSAGYLGVGTANPSSVLQVEGGDIVFLSADSGQVGIGTPSPIFDLHISRANEANLRIEGDGTFNDAVWSVASLDTGDIWQWDLRGDSATDYENYNLSHYDASGPGWHTILGIKPDGSIGIGTNDPDTYLDVDGTIKIAYSNETCNANTEGAIRYDSLANTFSFCALTANDWETVSLGAGTLAALSDTTIAAPSTGQILYYSGTQWVNNALALSDLTDAATAYSSGSMYVGQGAGASITSGNITDNTFIGYNAGNVSDGIRQTTIVGSGAGSVGAVGNFNTLIGYFAGRDGPGTNNVMIGDRAGLNAVANDNIFIGSNAASRITDGSQNVVIGRSAGGSNSVANGDRSNLTILGYGAGQNLQPNANNNTFVGHLAGNNVTFGTDNLLIGASADVPFATASNYLNIGDIFYGSMGTGELFIGGNGALTLPSGAVATRPGDLAGTTAVNGMIRYNSTSDRFEGYQAGTWQDILTSSIAGGAALPDRGIQFNSGNSFAADANFVYTSAGRLGLGNGAPETALDVDGTIKIAYGNETCNANTEGAIRYDSLANTFSFCALTANDWETVSLGAGTLAALSDTTIAAPSTGQILYFSGTQWVNNALAINDLSDGVADYTSANMFLGQGAGGSFGAADADNIGIGLNVLSNLDGSGALRNIVIGQDAGRDIVSAHDNVLLGHRAGERQVNGNDYHNVMIGSSAGRTNMGTKNTFIGGNTAVNNDGAENTVVGATSFTPSNGSFNTIIGSGAVTGSGGSGTDNNTVMGRWAARNLIGGNNNTVVGEQVALTLVDGDNNLVIGTSGLVDVPFASVSNYINIGNVLYGSAGTGELFIGGNGALTLPSGAVATRPGDLAGTTAVNGMIRYNSTSDRFEGYQAGLWQDILTSSIAGGAALPDRGIQFNSGNSFAADANFVYTSAGRLGLGNGAPETALDVDGTIKIAYGNETCNANTEGAIRFDSGTNTFSFCALTANDWETITLGAGTLAALSDTTIAAPSTGQILYFSGTQWVNNALAINDLSDGVADYTSANLFLGQASASAPVTGENNVVVGGDTGGSLVSASRNALLGAGTGGNIDTGNDNVAIGYRAASSVTDGYRNVAIGNYAGQNMAYQNTYVGERAGRDGTGNNNTYIGRTAGSNVTTGNSNVIVGAQSESPVFVAGSNNIIVGAFTDTPFGTIDDYINIGDIFYGSMGTGELFIGGNGALTLPSGAVATRPGDLAGTTAVNGMIRYNSTSDRFEGYQGGTWQDILTSSIAGGAALPDRGIQFNSGGSFAADATLQFTSGGGLNIGTFASASVLDEQNFGIDKYALRLVGQDTAVTAPSDLMLSTYSNSATVKSDIDFYKARGTEAAPADIQIDDEIGLMRWYGFRNGNYRDGASIAGIVSGLGGSVIDADISLRAGSASNEIMRISRLDRVGIMTSSPDTTLDVRGEIKFSSTGLTCNPSTEGAIRFDSGTNTFSFCALTANDWETITLGAGTLAALSDTTIAAPSDGQVLYYSGSGWVNNALAINDLSDGITNYTSANMFLGQGAGASVTTSHVTAIGFNAGAAHNPTVQSNSVFIGSNAGQGTSESFSAGLTIIGGGALQNATTGALENTTAIGNYALYSLSSFGRRNTAVGSAVANYLNSGQDNTFLGQLAGSGNTTNYSWNGSSNVFIGKSAAAGLDGTNDNNTIVGTNAAASLVTGSDNLLIGYGADVPFASASNYLNIGDIFYGSMGTGELFFGSAGAVRLPVGDDSTRPGTLAGTTAINGMIRYNSTSDRFEGYQGGTWQDIVTGSAVGALNDLTDVDTTGVSDTDVLTYDSASGNWVPAAVSTDFLSLTDTPGSYAGQGGRFARVNSGETAVEFTDELIEIVSGEPAPSTLDLNDLGDVSASPAGGQALIYDSASGNWVAGTVDGGSVGAAGNDREIQFNSNGNMATDGNFVFTSTGLGIGTAAPTKDFVIYKSSGSNSPTMLLQYDGVDALTSGTLAFSRPSAAVGRKLGEVIFGYQTFESSISGFFDPTDATASELRFATNNYGIGPATTDKMVLTADGRLGLGNMTPRAFVEFASSGAMIIPAGLDSDRPTTGVAGMVRFSSTSNTVEFFNGTIWESFATSAGSVTTAGAEGDLQFNSGNALGAVSGLNFSVGSGTLSVDSIVSIGGTTGAAAPVGAVVNTASLVTLTDTNISSAANGEILSYNGSNWVNIPSSGAGLWTDGTGDSIYYNSGTPRVGIGLTNPAVELDVTGDVNLTGMLNLGQMAGNAPTYISSGFFALNALTDVDTTGFADGDVLMYSAGASGWVAGTAAGGGASALNDLTDAGTQYASSSMYIGQGTAFGTATGIMNTALGFNAGRDLTFGDYNTFFGGSAGRKTDTGSQNTFIGYEAGDQNTDGTENVFIGQQAGNQNVSGIRNVYVGEDAADEALGSYNTVIGNLAAQTLVNGDNNILIGASADVPAASTSNYLNIGDVIYASGLYNTGAQVGINNATPNVALDVTGDIEYTGTLTDVSDMRLKKDITPLDADDIIGRLSQIDTYSFRMIDDKKGQIELGVMAQEVEKVFPELVRTAKDDMGTKSVNYIGFIAPLIEASKELKAENDALRAEINGMKLAQAEFKDDLLREVNGLKAHTGYGINKAQIGPYMILWMIALIIGFSSVMFLAGAIIRQRQHKQG